MTCFHLEWIDFKVTVGYESQSPWSNPVCVEAIDINQIVDNQITIQCPTVMRGRYVTFIRIGPDIHVATLCEVVVMGRRVIRMY